MQLTMDLDTPPAGAGVVFVAYRDIGETMAPVASGGRLVLFQDLDQARAAAGVLGVASPQDPATLPSLARRHGLTVPAATGGGD